MFKNIVFENMQASYYLLLILPLVLLFSFSIVQRRRALKNFASEGSLSSLLFLERRTLIRYFSLAAVWVLSALALMQPQKLQHRQLQAGLNREVVDEQLVDNKDKESILVKRRACDVIFLLDTSASMMVKDTRTKSTRLGYAKEIVDEIVSGLDGQNVALYSFTSQLTSIVPSTLDYFFTRLMLKNVDVNYGDVAGTDLFEALDQINRKHLQISPDKQKVLVLLTDGGDTFINTLSKEERSNQIEVMLSKLNDLEKQNVRIFSIGVGSDQNSYIPDVTYEGNPVMSSLDSELLKEISKKGRGQYYFANDYSSIALSENILKVLRSENSYIEQEEIAQKKIKRTLSQDDAQASRIHLFQYPLGVALILFSLEMIIPIMPTRERVDL